MTNSRKILMLSLVGGIGLAVIPFFLPTGPDAAFDSAKLLESGRFLVAAALIFATGLVTALTPCVYPLIPITVGVFGARKAESRAKAAALTSSYVVGMGAVFSALGVAAALTGHALGSILGNPIVVVGLALFLLAMAASMFGAFELTLPSGLTQRLNSVGGAGFLGAFLMGSVSGFLAAPCTGPVLASLLAYVAKTQNAALGAGLLFIYALGVGFPFMLIGIFALKLPKGGAWMEDVKSVLGIALVALAGLYLKDGFAFLREPLADAGAQLGRIPGAWIAGAVAAAGILAGAVHLSFKAAKPEVVRKALTVTVVVAAVLLRVGALNTTSQGTVWVKLGFVQPEHRELVWDFQYPRDGGGIGHFDGVLAQARAEHRPVMIDFGADWCAACKELERNTYVVPDVVQASKCFTNIKVDGTDEGDDVEALYKRYGIQGLPTVLFVSGDGRVLDSPRVTGFLKADRFLTQMEKVRGLTSDTSVCSR